MRNYLLIIIFLLSVPELQARTLNVGVGQQYARLQDAAMQAQPGDTILLEGGSYQGGDYIENLKGTETAWITIRARTGATARFSGGSQAFHLSDPAYLRIEGLTFSGQTANGVNIDDGGTYETPAHFIIIDSCTFEGLNATGNNDELKLSGVDNFVVTRCHFESGSPGGSYIDMVGCHAGLFELNYFTGTCSNSIQAKGGSRKITIYRNYFNDAGERALNIGGSTGLQFFRPLGVHFEASNIYVHSNIFRGSTAPIAYVGAVNCEVVNNTIIFPERWAIRILQETTDSSFLPCGNNIFRNNIVVFNTQQPAINIGPSTAPETFTFSNNLWYNPDNLSWVGPNTPTSEPGRVLNMDPLFIDSQYHLQPASPAKSKGFDVTTPELDFDLKPFASPRSIGALEVATSAVTQDMLPMTIAVFPNPAHNELTISMNEEKSVSVTIIDLLGRTIWQDQIRGEKKIDTHSWLPGTYLLYSREGSRVIVIQ